MFRFLHQGEIRTTTPRQLLAGAVDYLITATKYMGGKVEPTVISESSPTPPTPVQKILASPDEIKNVQVIKPPSKEFLAQLLKVSDEQPTSRLGYKALDELTDGSPFFSQSTGPESLHKRKQVLAYLSNPNLYAAVAKAAIEASTSDDASIRGREIVQRIIAKAMFGLDQVPPNTNAVFTEMDHQFDSYARSLALPKGFRESALNSATIRAEKAKTMLAEFTQAFLQLQLPQLMAAIKSSSTSSRSSGSLTADVILDLMRQEGKEPNKEKLKPEDLIKYFSHPDVKSLAWIFLAGSNISKTVARGIRLMASNPDPLVYAKMGESVIAQLIKDYKGPLNFSAIKDAISLSVDKYLDEFKHSALKDYLPQTAFEMRGNIINSLRPELLQCKSNWYDATYNLDDLRKLQGLISAKIEAGPKAPDDSETEGGLLTHDVRQASANFFDDAGVIQARDLQNSPAMDALYEFCLSDSIPSLYIARFVKQAVKIGDVEIPANTYIQIELGGGIGFDKERDAKEEKAETSIKRNYHLFSAGPRMCPGARIAEYIFKAVSVEMMRALDQELVAAVKRADKGEKDEEKTVPVFSLGGPHST